jgi:hypothetical protein
MPFNRAKAVAYADKHWNIPCDDSIFWLSSERIIVEQKRKQLNAPAKDGWEPKFVQGGPTEPEIFVFERARGGTVERKLINGWAGLADCAHYLSRCLTAGGISVDERGVTSLVRTLQARSDTKTLCQRVARPRAQAVIDTGIFKPGDMIGYFNISPDGDYGGRESYTHSTMYVGKLDKNGHGGVTCHTVARFPPRSWVNDSWWLNDHYEYTLIHFTSDDTKPNLILTKQLEGWWESEAASKKVYWRVRANGTARFSFQAPKSAADSFLSLPYFAYWFMDDKGNVTLISQKTGAVVAWTGPLPGLYFQQVVDGKFTGPLKKLFTSK